MCVVSMITDGWKDQFPHRFPEFPNITRGEFEALKKEVEELKKLLLEAKKFDEITGQPNCEMEDKVKLLKEIAKVVGVDLKSVFNTTQSGNK